MFPIYEKLGGKDAVLDVIERRTFWRPTSYTLKKWAANRAISAKASIALMAECEDRGIPVSVDDFRKSSTSPCGAAA